MKLGQTIAEMRTLRQALTGRVALVPTMGALHRGHVALMHAARAAADHVIVSIFVNPTQFAAHEDFDRYPRPIDDDLAQCRRAGAAIVFAPSASDMYPPDVLASDLSVPDLSAELEGEYRPGHFNGVCRVVAKLLNIIQPDVAIFGQKDYQQWRIIEAFARDLNMPVKITALPTVRDGDGLALSSRNAYLLPEQRSHALGLFKALTEARMLIEDAGETDPAAVEHAMLNTLATHHVEVDYAVVRHPHTLTPLDSISPQVSCGVVALIAGRVGNVRLIDNMLIGDKT
jgi:pantoate--beta-alanine ligase